MKKVYLTLASYLLIFSYSCQSQEINNERKLLAVFESQLLNTEVSSLIFLSDELVSICVDTTNMSKFLKYLKNWDSRMAKTSDDEKERFLAMHILYRKIFSLHPNEPALQVSRQNLLDVLNNYRSIDFEVDAKLLTNQLDNSQRSMINDYDEGATNVSWIIFFSYNPILLKETLYASGNTKSWERSDLRLCNTFRDNSIPILVRNRIKQNIISHMEQFSQDQEIQKIISKFEKCNVSINLYD